MKTEKNKEIRCCGINSLLKYLCAAVFFMFVLIVALFVIQMRTEAPEAADMRCQADLGVCRCRADWWNIAKIKDRCKNGATPFVEIGFSCVCSCGPTPLTCRNVSGDLASWQGSVHDWVEMRRILLPGTAVYCHLSSFCFDVLF